MGPKKKRMQGTPSSPSGAFHFLNISILSTFIQMRMNLKKKKMSAVFFGCIFEELLDVFAKSLSVVKFLNNFNIVSFFLLFYCFCGVCDAYIFLLLNLEALSFTSPLLHILAPPLLHYNHHLHHHNPHKTIFRTILENMTLGSQVKYFTWAPHPLLSYAASIIIIFTNHHHDQHQLASKGKIWYLAPGQMGPESK